MRVDRLEFLTITILICFVNRLNSNLKYISYIDTHNVDNIDKLTILIKQIINFWSSSKFFWMSSEDKDSIIKEKEAQINTLNEQLLKMSQMVIEFT